MNHKKNKFILKIEKEHIAFLRKIKTGEISFFGKMDLPGFSSEPNILIHRFRQLSQHQYTNNDVNFENGQFICEYY